nr:hypothetical protein [Fictibacillus solisalsi]
MRKENFLLSIKYEKRMRPKTADKTYFTKGWGYFAALALLLYAILKWLWAWGSTVGLTTQRTVQGEAGFGDTLKDIP